MSYKSEDKNDITFVVTLRNGEQFYVRGELVETNLEILSEFKRWLVIALHLSGEKQWLK